MNEIRDKINVNIMNHGEMKYNVLVLLIST